MEQPIADAAKLDFTVKVTPREIRFMWPPDSEPIRDPSGNVIYEVELDEAGNPIVDEFFRPKLRFDANGQPIPKMTPAPQPESQREVLIVAWPLTRRMRMGAIEAVAKSQLSNQSQERLGILEKELVNRCIRSSNIVGIPGDGWEALGDHRLGDRIVRELRIWEQLSGMEAIEQGKGRSPGP